MMFVLLVFTYMFWDTHHKEIKMISRQHGTRLQMKDLQLEFMLPAQKRFQNKKIKPDIKLV